MSENEVQDNNGDTSRESFIGVSLSELIAKAKELLITLTNINTVESQSKLEEYLNTLLKLKEEYITQGTNEVMEKVQEYIYKIKVILEKSMEIVTILHVDVSECFQDKEKEIENIGQAILDSFKKDVASIENETCETFNKSVEYITNVTNELKVLPGQLTGCLLSWNPVPAIEEFLQSIKDMITSIPLEIGNVINEATELLNSLPSRLLHCIQNALEKLDKQSAEILYNIGISVAGKIRDSALEYITK